MSPKQADRLIKSATVVRMDCGYGEKITGIMTARDRRTCTVQYYDAQGEVRQGVFHRDELTLI